MEFAVVVVVIGLSCTVVFWVLGSLFVRHCVGRCWSAAYKMKINCSCECNCSDRASCSTNITDRRPGDIMANGDCYRRLSNSSSALYGSCPQLTQHCDLIQQQEQQPHCPHLNASEQVAQQAKQHYQSTHQQTRQYSSLVRSRPSRSPVLCQRCAVWRRNNQACTHPDRSTFTCALTFTAARTTKHNNKAAKEVDSIDPTAVTAATSATAKNASVAKSTSLAFVSYKPTALTPKINRAQHLQQEFTSSIATPAVTASRYLCRRCRYNNQPITWWVSCPRLSNLGSSLSLQQSAVATTEPQLQQQQQTATSAQSTQATQAIPLTRGAGSNYDYQQKQQQRPLPAPPISNVPRVDPPTPSDSNSSSNMATTAAAKKTVTRQQLYGSNRCLRQQSSVHYPLDHGAMQPTHVGGASGGTLKRQSCALSHSRSITALQNMDLYGSYATLPSSAAAAPLDTPQRAYCARHLPTAGGGGGGGAGISGSHTWHPSQYAAAAPCCHLYNANQAAAAPTCMYAGSGIGHTCQQQAPPLQAHQQQQQYPRAALLHDSHKPLVPNGCYFGELAQQWWITVGG